MSFKEFTLVNCENYCEVMIDLNTKSGKVVDLYCYADNIPSIENESTGHLYKMQTIAGKNPVFLHIKNKPSAYKLFIKNGFIFSMNEEDESYEEDVLLIEKSLAFYNLSKLASPY